jgi:hypothetical protein
MEPSDAKTMPGNARRPSQKCKVDLLARRLAASQDDPFLAELKMRRFGSTLAIIVAGLATTLMAPAARADVSPDRAAAEALAVTALALVQKGEILAGCAKFAASTQIEPTARRFLNLADCQLKAGLTATAWLSFVEARERAERNGDRELSRSARRTIEQLQETLGYIEIVVPEVADLSGLEIRRDGILLPESARGLAVAVDPGPHRIAVQAPGRRPWSTQLSLGPGSTKVTITVPTLEVDPENPVIDVAEATTEDARLTEDNRLPIRVFGGTALLPPPDPPQPQPQPQPPDLDVGRTQRTIAWMLSGVGVVSLGASVGLAIAAHSTKSDLETLCTAGTCPAWAADPLSRYQSQTTAANVFLGLGIASIAGAAVVYLTAPSPGGERTLTSSLRVAPVLGQGNAGVLAAGNF